MKPWSERSPEFAALFNPAFCGTILYVSVVNYQKQDQSGMPFPLAFLVLPILFSSAVRHSLPRTTRTSFHLWLRREPQVQIELSKRTRNLSPITREALIFLMQRKLLRLRMDRLQRGMIIRGLNGYTQQTADTEELAEGARILGTMFGRVNDALSIFTSLGLAA